MPNKKIITTKIEYHECILCHQTFYGMGNNPAPLSEEGRCCDKCDNTKVIPERIINWKTKNELRKLCKICKRL